MPIPTPTAEESQQEFMARCHSAMADEFPDEKQRHALCMDAWNSGMRSNGRIPWTATEPQEPEQRGHATSLAAFRNDEERAYRAGRWLQAALFGNDAAKRWCKRHGLSEKRVMVETDNTVGGYLAPDVLANAVFDTREQFGLGRRFATVWPMTSDHEVIPRNRSTTTATWSTETTEDTAADLALGALGLTAVALRRLVRVSNSLIEDSPIDLASLIATDAGRAFAQSEDDAIFNGDGSSTYGHFMGLRTLLTDVDGAGTNAASANVAATNDDTFAELNKADVEELIGFVNPTYLAGSRWWFAPIYLADALPVGYTIGHVIYPGIAEPTLNGYPYSVTTLMPNSGSTDYTGLTMLMFGDMRAAVTIGSRREITIRRAGERYAEFDQTGIFVTERVAIHCFVGNATNRGPMAGLIGG